MSSVSTGARSSGVSSNETSASIDITGNTWSWSETGSNSFISFDKRIQWGQSVVTEHESSEGTSGFESGSWNSTIINLGADTTYKVRAKGIFTWYSFDLGANKSTTKTGTIQTKKTGAVNASASTPSVSSITSSSALVSENYFPNVNESTCTAQLQYKKQSDSTWTNFGTPKTNGGYSQVSFTNVSLTGLIGGTAYNVRLLITRTTNTGTSLVSSTASFTTLPDAPTVTTENATSVTSTGGTLNGTLDPNNISTSAYLTWGTSTGSYPNEVFIETDSDNTLHNLSTAISGLTPSTTYYFRTKGVYGGSTVYGTEKTFTTDAPPPIPSITTGSASSIGETTAQLNGTVNPNAQSTTYYFEWGTTTAYGNTTATQGPNSGTSNVPFSAAISSLTANTLYHFRAVAVAVYSGGTVNGNDATFTSAQTPAGASLDEEHTIQMELDAAYKQAFTAFFPLMNKRDTSGDVLFTGTAPTAAECFIFKNGGTGATATNAAVAISNGLYSLTLTANEMEAFTVDVIIHSATGIFRDVYLRISTKLSIGDILVDASQVGNGDALSLTSDSGKSLNANKDLHTDGKLSVTSNVEIGGNLAITGNRTMAAKSTTGDLTISDLNVSGDMPITGNLNAAFIVGRLGSQSIWAGDCQGGGAGFVTLDVGASSVNDFYAGATIIITFGKGVGQYRHITAYDGISKRCTVHTGWLSNPDSTSDFLIVPSDDSVAYAFGELSSIPLALGYFGDKIQALYQRFFFKRTHDRTTPFTDTSPVLQTLYKADGSTILGTANTTDTGGDEGPSTFVPTWSL